MRGVCILRGAQVHQSGGSPLPSHLPVFYHLCPSAGAGKCVLVCVLQRYVVHVDSVLWYVRDARLHLGSICIVCVAVHHTKYHDDYFSF